MDKSRDNLLTSTELSLTLIGTIIATGILSLPRGSIVAAKQDSWISVLIGSLYPLYIIVISNYIIRNSPDENIISIYKKYLGKIVGNIINFGFMLFFIMYFSLTSAHAIDIFRIYTVWFIEPLKMAIIIVILAVYICIKGIKALARVNVITFFIVVMLFMISFVSLKESSIYNIQPVFGVGVENIIKGSSKTLFLYAGMEFLLIIHPFVKNKKTIAKYAYRSWFFVTLIYTWVALISISFLGHDTTQKILWPFLFVMESVRIPVINSFRFVFIFLWIVFIFKTLCNDYYASTLILSNITTMNRRKACLFFAPVALFVVLRYQNEIIRRKFADALLPWLTIFSVVFVTLAALMIIISKLIHKGKKSKSVEN